MRPFTFCTDSFESFMACDSSCVCDVNMTTDASRANEELAAILLDHLP